MLCVLVLAMSGGASTCMKPNPLSYSVDAGESDDGDSSESESSGDTESDGDGDGDDTELPEILDVAEGEGDTQSNTCAPLDEFDPECGSCLGASCCEFALACEAVADCPCLASCLLDGGSNGACKQACNGTKANMPELDPVLDCMAQACEAEC
jgi:hypothetical protein